MSPRSEDVVGYILIAIMLGCSALSVFGYFIAFIAKFIAAG